MKRSHTLSVLALLVACIASTSALANRSSDFGDYQVHYNALTTNLLDPSVARAYGIIRSKNRALVNVAILRRVMGMATQPVRAKVTAEAVNESAQLREIDMRELNDGGAIYYIGEIPVSHNETLEIKINVTPEGDTTGFSTTFRQEFYTE